MTEDSKPQTQLTISPAFAQPAPEDEDFDWYTDDSIVVPPRPGVAIYENRKGDVVIRTQNVDAPFDEDHFAFLSDEALQPVMAALQRIRRDKAGG
jgi:hypothetical protein